jgi:hypothetical protein
MKLENIPIATELAAVLRDYEQVLIRLSKGEEFTLIVGSDTCRFVTFDDRFALRGALVMGFTNLVSRTKAALHDLGVELSLDSHPGVLGISGKCYFCNGVGGKHEKTCPGWIAWQMGQPDAEEAFLIADAERFVISGGVVQPGDDPLTRDEEAPEALQPEQTREACLCGALKFSHAFYACDQIDCPAAALAVVNLGPAVEEAVAFVPEHEQPQPDIYAVAAAPFVGEAEEIAVVYQDERIVGRPATLAAPYAGASRYRKD